jgi:peptidyl-prolyl cis-trans isomerase A (cyclophilin A)
MLAILGLTTVQAKAQTEVTFYTSMGNFEVMLTDTLTPITVDSFLARVSDKFYDGTIFHRVIDNFMIQGGDPTGTGSGGPGYTFPDEFHPSLKNVPGALAMANSGPNTNGSQFYVNLVTNNHLNNHHTVFGMVTNNFSVVQDIGNVPTNASDKPLTDVVLDSIRLTAFPTAISNLSNKAVATVHPNPCRGVFAIDFPGEAKLEILDLTGKLIYAAMVKNRVNVDLRDEPAGLYIVRLTADGCNYHHKLIIQ